MAKLKLGKRYRDEVTGFEGIVTAHYEFLNGCHRYQLERGKSDGGIEELVFDEQRLEPVKEQPKLSGRTRATGGPQRSAPVSRGGTSR